MNREQGIETLEFKIKPDIRKLVESAWNYEAKVHQLSKTKRQREWYEKNAKLCDIDLDDELNLELDQYEQANNKKKVQVLESKDKMKTVLKKNQNNGRLDWKPNSVFLDPNNIKQLAERMNEIRGRTAGASGAPRAAQAQRAPAPQKKNAGGKKAEFKAQAKSGKNKNKFRR